MSRKKLKVNEWRPEERHYSFEKKKNDPDAPHRALINAILLQAFCDALNNKMDAVRFIDSDNKLFRYYCSLIGWDPIYVEYKMHKQLRAKKLPALTKFRD